MQELVDAAGAIITSFNDDAWEDFQVAADCNGWDQCNVDSSRILVLLFMK